MHTTDFAHIRQTDTGGWLTQSIADHSEATAALAEGMAEAFGAGAWGRLCGLWHDIGKYSASFQRHIISSSGYDTTVSDPGRVDHSTAGALYAKERLKNSCLPLAYCICGHHSGLMDYDGNGHGCLQFHLSAQEEHLLSDVRQHLQLEQLLPQLPAPRFDNDTYNPKSWHLWIRMLFSCLVDADRLDAEQFDNPVKSARRSRFKPLSELSTLLDSYLHDLSAHASSTTVNTIRADVQAECRKAAALPQGIYSLTVPTGGGKTLSSLVWALGHARHHGLRRIIIAIPYTSIVVQTADLLRKIFGQENVVEHHSYADFDSLPEKQRERMELAAENWDAPIIVTTNVQLFESLFSNRPSQCRKLHNIARSVVILDEVQMLPAEHLHPIVDVLGCLSRYMGTSILLTTATQPALTGAIGSGQARFEGLQCREIVADRQSLYDKMRRVDISIEPHSYGYGTLASQLAGYSQVLCVVNTRGEAQKLYSSLADKTSAYHLSRMMCQEHLGRKLDEIKLRLRRGEPVVVVSTQLIEAGVDIDFPVVWRAMAGLDSIAQSAGRCNREGRQERGHVHVFEIEGARLQGSMAKAAYATRDLLRQGQADFLSPQAAEEYFRIFYAKINDTDKGGMAHKLYRPCPQFQSAGDAFRMIDNDNQLTVYVPYGQGAELTEQLRQGFCTRQLLRRLQRYSVGLPVSRRGDLEHTGAIRLTDSVYVLPDLSCYDDSTGLMLGSRWADEELII